MLRLADASPGGVPANGAPPRLIPQVVAALRVRHYSERTVEAYVGSIRRFIRFHGLRHPRDLAARDVERFLTSLAVDAQVAPSTQNQALAALLFLYRDVLAIPLALPEHAVRAKTRARVPVVLTRDEVWATIGALERAPAGRTPALVVTLLYGAGLRLSEALCLRVKDLDLNRGELTVRAGKGGKGRSRCFPTSRECRSARTSSESARCTGEISRVVTVGWRCRTRSRASGRTRGATGAGSGCFRPVAATATSLQVCGSGIVCTRPRSSVRWRWPCVPPDWRSGRAATPSGTPSRRTCWRMGTMCVPSRSYWGTRT